MTTFFILASFALGLYLGLTLKDKQIQLPTGKKKNQIVVLQKKVEKTEEEDTVDDLDKRVEQAVRRDLGDKDIKEL